MQTLRLVGTHYGHVTASGNMQLIVVLIVVHYGHVTASGNMQLIVVLVLMIYSSLFLVIIISMTAHS